MRGTGQIEAKLVDVNHLLFVLSGDWPEIDFFGSVIMQRARTTTAPHVPWGRLNG